MRRLRTHGFTLIEVLVVLAVLGSVAGIGLTFARPASDMRAAVALRSVLLWARAEALWQGASVAVRELPLGLGYEARRLEPGADACDSGEVIGRLLLAEHPGVRIAAGLGAREGLLWLPTGGGRSCDGGGVISATIVLRSPLGATRVVVSSLGRVRVERVP
jgi:prepilin-type N-terminal cleavage/methylation domain-containing protein